MPKGIFQKIAAIVISIGIGFLLVMQIRSFAKVETLVSRDRNPNIFREIQILRGVTGNLRKEFRESEMKLSEITNRTRSFATFSEEMKQLELLTGEKAVKGEGVRMVLPVTLDSTLFVDLVNELVTAGSEALTINSVRLTAKTAGFRSISGALLMGDQVLRPPYTIEAIGNKQELSSVLLQPGGLIERLEKALGKEKLALSQETQISIPVLP